MRCKRRARRVLPLASLASLASLALCGMPGTSGAQGRGEGAIPGLESARREQGAALTRVIGSAQDGGGVVPAADRHLPPEALRPTLSLADDPAVLAESNRGKHAMTGALFGAIGGGIAGAIMGGSVARLNEAWGGDDNSKAQGAVIGFVIGAASGAVLGALIGVLIP